ncbi:MAG TPA: M64 family metallopeptidase [Nocardioidaceae bacterium]|nr:M64 family metallopeptidase [Nocardioidaceae bacterium]
MTPLIRVGPPGAKRDIAIVGDGFTESDQDVYDNYVRDAVMNGVFGRDYYYEDSQAFNVFRVNLFSTDSGVSTHTYDSSGNLVNRVDRNTALDTIYTGEWSRCWMEDGPNTGTRLTNALTTWVPDWDFVLIVLNTTGFGGCRRGNRLYVTRGVGWDVIAHEFGHGFASLADEYCRAGSHAGGEPGEVNVTANTDRASLKWRRYVRSSTPVPTGVNPSPGNGACTGWNQGTRPSWWDSALDAGVFEGAKYRDQGLYRPAENCRMRGNAPPFCPICYSEIKRIQHPFTGRTFEKVYTGDFNGDGRDDILVHTGNCIQLYRSDGSALDLAFSGVERVPGSWQFSAGDQFLVGDINGDGKDEVVVYNSTNWNQEYLGLLADDGSGGLRLIRRYDDAMTGWQFHRHDRFVLADFNGDGRADLVVANGDDWSMPYLGMLRSDGNGFSVVRRYDGSLAGWQMRKGDQYLPGDLDGDGQADLYVFNGTDWSVRYFAMLRSTGTSYTMVRRFDNNLGGWSMAKGDRHVVGDFDGDGRDDVYVFNGDDWSMAYLGMLSSTGDNLTMTRRYDGNAPGWQMRRHDQHYAADIDGNGRTDLFVYNHQDWATEYLGTMVSTGNALVCGWKADWVGEWNLGSVDQFESCNYEGAGGRRNLVVHNQEWLGLIRATPALSLQRIYYRWIHNYRHGRNW